MVKGINYVKRDENAKELNDLLEQMLENLEMFSEGIDEDLLNLAEENMKSNNGSWDVMSSIEDNIRYFELITQRNILQPVIVDLKNILYTESEFVPLLRKEPAEYVRREDYAIWVMRNVKPLIQKGVRSQRECAEMLNREQSGISKMVTRGLHLTWKEFCELIDEGSI